jgi:hypothetical protein
MLYRHTVSQSLTKTPQPRVANPNAPFAGPMATGAPRSVRSAERTRRRQRSVRFGRTG